MGNEMNKMKLLEELLAELAEEGKAVRIPLGNVEKEVAVDPGTAEKTEQTESQKVETAVTINIENFHIHMDERMTSNNCISSGENVNCDEEDPLAEINHEDMLNLIQEETGLCRRVILDVLLAQMKYLESIWGIEEDCCSEEYREEDNV